jgi:hypothetical protein
VNHRSWKRAALRALLAATLLLGGGFAASAADEPAAMAGVVNVNTATVAELELLPGVGPAKAGRQGHRSGGSRAPATVREDLGQDDGPRAVGGGGQGPPPSRVASAGR